MVTHVRFLPAMLILAATSLIYWPGLSGGFVFDDFPNIVTNTKLHATDLRLSQLASAATAYSATTSTRPLATLWFAADHAIHGKAAWGFKLSSLLVHLLNALLVFWLLKKLLAFCPGPLANGARNERPWQSAATLTPLFIALLWALHPLQVSTVLYVVQRMELLATTFVLLGLLAYLHGRMLMMQARTGWGWLVTAAAVGLAGTLAKETALLLGLFALALEVTVLGFQTRDRRDGWGLRIAYGTGLLLALTLFIIWALPPHLDPATWVARDFTLEQRLLTQTRVLLMYLGQIVWPVPSSMPFYYDTLQPSTGWLRPWTTLFSGLILGCLLASALALRRRIPLFALGVLWFFAAHAFTSNIFALELAFEHRNYFALLGVLLAIVGLLQHVTIGEKRAPLPMMAAATLVIAVLGLMRVVVWGDELRLAQHHVALSPQSGRASSDLANLFIRAAAGDPSSREFAMGIAELERGAALPEASPLPEHALLIAAATHDVTAKPEWWDSLEEKLNRRVAGPQEEVAVTGLLALRFQGVVFDDQRLLQAYQTLLTRRIFSAHHYRLLGDYALTLLKDEDLAIQAYTDFLRRSASPTDALRELAGVLTSNDYVSTASRLARAATAEGLLDGP